MKPKSNKDYQITSRKNELRKKYLELRKNMSPTARMMKSSRIAENLRELKAYQNAKTVMFFATYGTEIFSEMMMNHAWQDGKKIVLPKANMEDGTILAAVVNSIETDLEHCAYGIREPKMSVCKEIQPAKIDLVIVPGIVFDEKGNRIGYGKGYYDRWLRKFQRAKRVGVCFDFQMAKSIPQTETDTPAGMVITDSKVVRTSQEDSNKIFAEKKTRIAKKHAAEKSKSHAAKKVKPHAKSKGAKRK